MKKNELKICETNKRKHHNEIQDLKSVILGSPLTVNLLGPWAIFMDHFMDCHATTSFTQQGYKQMDIKEFRRVK